MNRRASSPPPDRASLLAGAIREAQLWWRLLRDGRVPLWTRAIPILTALYILLPFDLVMDPLLGFGQLDDLAIFVLGMELFVSLSPADVVDEVRREILSGRRSASDREEPAERVQTVDVAYRVVDDGPGKDSGQGTGVSRTGNE